MELFIKSDYYLYPSHFLGDRWVTRVDIRRYLRQKERSWSGGEEGKVQRRRGILHYLMKYTEINTPLLSLCLWRPVFLIVFSVPDLNAISQRWSESFQNTSTQILLLGKKSDFEKAHKNEYYENNFSELCILIKLLLMYKCCDFMLLYKVTLPNAVIILM